jgi:eukaryotic-like serine/threonine-protein kinase
VPPGRIIPGIPPDLDAVVLKALEKDPERRFADADEFIAALEDVRAGITGDPAPGRNGTGSLPVAPSIQPREPRRRWPLVALLVLAVVAAGAVAVWQLVLAPGEERAVPSVVGQEVGAATQQLRDAGFEVRVVRRQSSQKPRDRVYAQEPDGGRAEEGSTVEIRVSDGPGIGEVPQVEGLRGSQAREELTKAGFEIREERKSDDRIKENYAIGTDPEAGTQLEGGQTVTLILSTGPPLVQVPSVGGMSRDEATEALEAAGFKVQYKEQEDDSADPGTVLLQDPYNERAPKGSTVTITVAKRPAKVQVPSVGGSSLADATNALRGLGLRVSSIEMPVTDPSQDGTVIAQDPAPGTEVERDSRVNLIVGRAVDAGQQPDDGTAPEGDDGLFPDDGGQGQEGDG